MIEVNILGLAGRTVPFYVPWPRVGNPGAICEFATPDEWLTFLTVLDLNANVPQVVATKYSRAQRLYALSWLDFDLIKAGELAAITALEMALKDRYASLIPKERPMLGDLLRHLVVKDGSALPNCLSPGVTGEEQRICFMRAKRRRRPDRHTLPLRNRPCSASATDWPTAIRSMVCLGAACSN